MSECSHPHHQRPAPLRCAHMGDAMIEKWESGVMLDPISGHGWRREFPDWQCFDTWEEAEEWLRSLPVEEAA